MDKNKRKFIIGVLTTILGTGSVISLINIKSSNQITIQENNGSVIEQNNGVVKNYTMGGGTPTTKKEKNTEAETRGYNPTYIEIDEPLIHTDGVVLEGIYIENYEYSLDDVSFETMFGEDRLEIIFGQDHPNGRKLVVRLGDYAYNLGIEISEYTSDSQYVFDENGELREGSKVQVSPYDFDEDGVNELIICITDSIGLGGMCYIFSYTHVDDYSKINPFNKELDVFIQNEIYLNGNSLQIPIGSSRVISEEYKYVDERFMKNVIN